MPPKRNPNRSKSSNNAAVEIDAMADCLFPRDIMIAILTRLPVKSLFRFRCVCKPWSGLVFNPSFIKLHTTLSLESPRPRAAQTHLLNCPVLSVHPNRVAPSDAADLWLDHCNGMVCMTRPSYTQKIVLWNPATNLWKILPDSTVRFGAAQMVSLGFGCNADGDDFKVVRIACMKGRKMKTVVEVYSSKSGSWRTIEDVGFKFTVMYPKNHVIVNGDQNH
ncbi:F-box/kelch-repeat protein At3g23880-like [Salvia miltiorrhiza]|uniref:F-box/kelch-repeat protein At3g23880-like n=1 Tax=Salvia miltiorrhiza TaxID=226208 RepID=UPI0025ABE33D|nr:F-box/kelch-repeat protein At3g23880-like [Salvia miltiorrhiza]